MTSELTLQICLENFRCHGNFEFEACLSALTTLVGPSRSGKSTIFYAIPWALWQDGDPFPEPSRKGKLVTSVTVRTKKWTIHRSLQPGSGQSATFQVITDNGILRHEEAKDWVNAKFMGPTFWKLACYLHHTDPNILLMTTNEATRLKIVRNLVHRDDDVAAKLEKIGAFEKTLKTDLLRLEGTEKEYTKHLKDKPVFEETWVTMTVDQLNELRHSWVLRSRELAGQDILLGKLEARLFDLKSRLPVGSIRPMEQDVIDQYEKNDVVCEWRELLRGLEIILEISTSLHENAGEIIQAKKSLEFLNPPEDIFDEILPSAKSIEESSRLYENQLSLFATLEIPEDTTESEWNLIQKDAILIKAQQHAVADLIREGEKYDDDSKALTNMNWHIKPTKEIYEWIQSINVREKMIEVKQLKSRLVGFTSDDVDVEEYVKKMIADLEKEILVHTKSLAWEKARKLFARLQSLRKVEDIDLAYEKLKALQQRRMEAGLQKLTCPECATLLYLQDSHLQRAKDDFNETMESLDKKLQDMEKEIKEDEEGRRILKEIRALRPDKQYEQAEPLEEEQVKEIQEHMARLRIILQDYQKLNITHEQYIWMCSNGERYMEAAKIKEDLQKRLEHMEKTRKSIYKSLGLKVDSDDDEIADEDIFEVFWMRRGNRRTWRSNMLAFILDSNLPKYTHLPQMSTEVLEKITEARKLRIQIAALEEKQKVIERKVYPPLNLPPFPEFPELTADYLESLQDNHKVEHRRFVAAVNHVRNVVRSCEAQQKEIEHFIEHRDIMAEIKEIEPKLVQLKIEHEEREYLHTQLPKLEVYTAWMRRYLDLDESMSHGQLIKQKITLCKELDKDARFTENQLMEIRVETLASDANAILRELFDEPVLLKCSMFKKYKTNDNVTPSFQYELDINGRVVTSVIKGALSNGEMLRVCLAVSISIAKLYDFPVFAVDEMLSSLNTDLAHRAVRTIRAHLPNKAIVMITHDQEIPNIHQTIEMPATSPIMEDDDSVGTTRTNKKRVISTSA